jgi:hypothetical protein
VFGCETIDHRLEHLAAHHQPMHEEERWAGPTLGEENQP